MSSKDRLAARFNVLLAFLVFSFVVGPYLEPGAIALVGLRLGIVLTLVGAVWSLSPGRGLPIFVTVVMLASETSHWLASFWPEPALIVASRVLTLAFVGVAAGFLSWFFWSDRGGVGAASLAGALGVYLLLGYFWASSFGLLEFLEPGSFEGVCAPRPGGEVDCDPSIALFPRMTYLSFVTMTTLGYGDVTPLTLRAEGLATLCAVSGQLFLAVLIGRLVGGYVGGRGSRD